MEQTGLTSFSSAFWRLNQRRLAFWGPILAISVLYFWLRPSGDFAPIFVPALLIGSYGLFRHSRNQKQNAEAIERLIADTPPRNGQWTAVCGTLRPEELRYLFPTAGNVGSAAVVPLVKGGDLGLIAVGSDDPNHYSATMGTLFLNHLGEVLVRLVPRLGGDLSRE